MMHYAAIYLGIGWLYTALFMKEIKAVSQKPVVAALAVSILWPAFASFIIIQILSELKEHLK